MDSLIKRSHQIHIKEQEREIKLQIVRQLRLERSLKKNSVEQKIVDRQVAYLTRKLDDILEYKQ
jgi:hypothetical protein